MMKLREDARDCGMGISKKMITPLYSRSVQFLQNPDRRNALTVV